MIRLVFRNIYIYKLEQSPHFISLLAALQAIEKAMLHMVLRSFNC